MKSNLQKNFFKFMFQFHLALSIFMFLGCSTPQTALQQKLNKNERLYIGNVFVDFNGQSNGKARCDLFLSSSLTAEFATSSNGFVSFKTKSKSPKMSAIACLYDTGKEKFWVHYPISTDSIKKSEALNEVSYFGDIYIRWTLSKEDIDNTEYNLGFQTDKKITGKGEFKIEIKNNYEATKTQFKAANTSLLDAPVRNSVFKIKED